VSPSPSFLLLATAATLFDTGNGKDNNGIIAVALVPIDTDTDTK